MSDPTAIVVRQDGAQQSRVGAVGTVRRLGWARWQWWVTYDYRGSSLAGPPWQGTTDPRCYIGHGTTWTRAGAIAYCEYVIAISRPIRRINA